MNDEKTEEDPIPSHMKALKICCVCGELNHKYQMTSAPKLKRVLKKWSQVFGPEFYETCWKSNVLQYICSIHWKQLRDDWEGPLPNVLEKMKKENDGSFEMVMFMNDINETGNFLYNQKHTCRYCGIECFSKDMTLVPENEQKLIEWSKRLGEEFLKNVQMHRYNRICWSHFKYRDRKHRHPDNLPMTDEMMNEKLINNKSRSTRVNRVKNYVFRIKLSNNSGPQNPPVKVEEECVSKSTLHKKTLEQCRYCGDIVEIKEMVAVPDNHVKLAYWVKNLGLEFSDNLSMNSTNFICWSHFNLESSAKPFYMNYLPNPEPIKPRRTVKKQSEKKQIFKVCRYCGDIGEIDEMVVVPKVRSELARWVKNLGPTFFENLLKNSINYICRSHSDLANSQNIKVCRYCGDVGEVKEMIVVPDDRLELALWVENLGSTFFENLITNSTNYICRNHFDLANRQKPCYMEDIPCLMSMKSQVEEMENEEKPDIKSLQEMVKFEEKDDHFENNEAVLRTDNACSTQFLMEDEIKPDLIKEE